MAAESCYPWSDDFVDETSGYDHSPVCASVTVLPHIRTEPRADRYNAAEMRTQEGRQQMAQILCSLPRIPWHVDVDSHLDLINTHIQQAIAQVFPVAGARIKKPCISESTWDLLRRRRDNRHLLRRYKQLRGRVLLHAVFEAWRQRVPSDDSRAQRFHRQYSRLCLSIARVARRIPELNRLLRACAKRDEANHIRTMFEDAWSVGPDAKARLMRCVLRTGRRYRAPCAAPALQRDDGTIAVERSEVLSMFGRHFAQAEHATSVRLADLVTQGEMPRQGYDWVDPTELPDVSDMSFAFAHLKCGKAAGLSSIPPEAFQVVPRLAAEVHLPLLLKAAARDQWPLLWRGGLAFAIPKPGRDPLSTSGWRSILLIEPACKAVCKAIRSRLVPALENSATVGMSGARPGRPVEFPSDFVQGHLARLKRRGKSGGVIYFDGQAAFYSILREFFFQGSETLSAAQMDRLAEAIHPSPDIQMVVRAFLTRSPVLAKNGVAPAICQVLQASLERTWFSVDTIEQLVYASQRGTVPGAPLADMLFQFTFGLFVSGLEQRLQDEGCFQRDDGQSAHASIPTWADDLAVLVESEQADGLPGKLKHVVGLTHGMMAAIGIQVNFGAGKSEAQIAVQGKESLKVRRDLLVHGNAELPVPLLDGRVVRLRLVETYLHLGTLTHAQASLMPELKRRAALAEGIFRQVRRAILTNRHVPLADKVCCVESLVVDKFLHNAGVWHFQTNAEEAKFHATVMSFRRRMLWPACGFSPQFLSDVETCAVLNVLLPEEILDIRRARQLCTLASFGDDYLRSAVADEKTWLMQATESFLRVAPKVARQPEEEGQLDACGILDLCRQRRSEILCAIRLHRKHILRDRVGLGREVERAAACRSQAEKLGVLLCRVPTLNDHLLLDGVRCEVCGKSLKDAQACAAHKRQAHGIGAPSTMVARGTACMVCKKEFWSTKRLKAHLYRVPQCLRVHVEADMPPINQQEVVSGDSAFQPVTDLIGPSPFWATLRPPLTPQMRHDDGPPESAASCYQSFLGSDVDIASSLRAALRCAARLECRSGQSAGQTFRELAGMRFESSCTLGCQLAEGMYDSWRRGECCKVDVEFGCLTFDGSQHVLFIPNKITEASGFGRAFRTCEALLDG